jgi:hypothetical protein
MIRVIRDADTNATKKALKKFLSSRKVESPYIKGDYTILRYRKYPEREEVDIEFKGQISAKYYGDRGFELNWYDSSIKKGATVCSVNGLIIRQIFNDLRQSLNYFGVNIEKRNIKKIIWK